MGCATKRLQPLRNRIPVAKPRVALRSRRGARGTRESPVAKRCDTCAKQSRKSNLYLEIFEGGWPVHGHSSFFYRDPHLDRGQEG